MSNINLNCYSTTVASKYELLNEIKDRHIINQLNLVTFCRAVAQLK